MNIERAVAMAVERLEEIDTNYAFRPEWSPAYRQCVAEVIKNAIEATHETKHSQPLSRYQKV